jgi:hypothetical protein
MGQQIGSTVVVRVAATVDLGAHVAGDVVAPVSIAPIDRLTGGGLLKQIAVFDDAGQAGILTFLFFDGALTGTYTLNGAPAPSAADKAKFLGAVAFAATDWLSAGGDAYGCKECALAIRHTPEAPSSNPGQSTPGSLSVVVVAGGTQDYAAATDLQIAFGILPDGA